jgi:Na+/H+ antiporter NhaD/arsenite permease-like protein/mannitol/fructose-specific phosphotransferase system IIA component (Ntr-type)
MDIIPAEMNRIENYLFPDLIFEVMPDQPEKLFRFVGNVLQEKGYINDPDSLVNELTAREKKGSTGIGEHIAIPHAFIPHLTETIIITLLLKKGIDFNAPDSLPVKVLFFVLSPEQKRDEYLKILARLATILHDPATKRGVVSAKTKADLYHNLVHRSYESFLYTYRQYFYLLGIIVGAFLFSLYFFSHISIAPTESAIKLNYLRFNETSWVVKQIVTFTIFSTIGVGTLLFWQYRVAIASAALGVLLFSGVVDLETTVKFMSIPTILFIISMMVVVAWLDSNGVFKFVITWVMKKIGPRPRSLYVILLLLSVFLGGLIGEVSAIIVTVTLAIAVVKKFDIDPFPFVIGLVFATNIGSALTLIGNPIGIYIAFAGNLTFNDFLRWTTPLSFVAAILIIFFTFLLFRKTIPKSVPREIGVLDPWQSVVNRREFYFSIIAFIILVGLISTHQIIESLLKLSEATVIIAAPLIIVGMIIFIEKERGKKFLVKDVDWWTILFFMFLFANAACLEYTGVTAKFAYLLEGVSQSITIPFVPADIKVTFVAALLLLFASAIASGFVDNLPIIAALVPIIVDLKSIGLPHANILWWALLFGGCFGGNLTMIGSSANVVALARYEEMTGRTVRFGQWFRYGLPVVIISVIFIAVALILQINLSP